MNSFPPINDYGLIGDTTSAALISKAASIDWLCWPRFDSPAIFIALLDREKGGRCDIRLHDSDQELEFVSRQYLPNTLVLETTLRAGDAKLIVTDFMPVRPRPGVTDDDDTDLLCDNRLVRMFRCEGAAISFRVNIWPTFDYANPDLGIAKIAALGNPPANPPIRMHPNTSGQKLGHFYVEAEHCPDSDDRAGKLWLDCQLKPGEQSWISLTEGEFGRVAPLKKLNDVKRLLEETTDYWTTWLKRCGDFGEFNDSVCRSLITLKALTYSPTGAIVAAPTMGLPESIGNDRNYDYRYCWVRDSSFTIRAFLMAGYYREARAFLRFLCSAEVEEGNKLPVMLGLDGVTPDGKERNLDHLSGYRSSKPVTVGNLAADQMQHDGWGETVNAIYSFVEISGSMPPKNSRGFKRVATFIQNLAECAANNWQEPDRGIWEWRDGQHRFFHSQAMCWLALDRASKLADRFELSEHRERWETLANTIREDLLQHGWCEELGAYSQARDLKNIDASVLRPALFGLVDMHEPRARKTLEQVRQKLGAPEDPDLIYRYLDTDGLQGREGTFSACAFWVMGVLAMAGDHEEATKLLKRLLSRGNDLGLFAEEIDPRDGSALGNFPQAFTHICVVIGAHKLLEMKRQLPKTP